MQRGRYIYLTALAGTLALAACAMPARAAKVNTPSSPILTAGDGAVLVTYGGVLGAVGYNVYSHAAGATAALINAKPTPYSWLIDDGAGKGLKNGTPIFYSVKAVFADSSGKLTEGPASPEAVTTPTPPLFGSLATYTIGTLNPGSVAYDSAKDLITVRASGDDIWDAVDQQTFVGTTVSGDFTITAKIPAPPKYEDDTITRGDGKIGLEMRTSLASDSPYALVFASVMRDPEILFEGHFTPEGTNAAGSATFSAGTTNFADLKFPVWIRLSRSGTTLAAQQSEDGTKWTDVTAAQDFTRLPDTLYVGIGATAHQDGAYLNGQVVASSLTLTTP